MKGQRRSYSDPADLNADEYLCVGRELLADQNREVAKNRGVGLQTVLVERPIVVERSRQVECSTDPHRQLFAKRLDHGCVQGSDVSDRVRAAIVGTMSSLHKDYTASLPSKRSSAAMLFVDRQSRLLLVEPTYKDNWELPGGAVEIDESPYGAAVREVREELGLAVKPGRLLVVDWVPADTERTESINFVFDGALLTAAQEADIALPPAELRSWEWCEIPGAESKLSALLTRRARAALQAHVDGTTVYLENGHPIV